MTAAAVHPPIASIGEAEALAAHMIETMGSLLGILEEETRRVRAGKLRDASLLEADKTELSRLYISDTMRLKASQPFLKQAAPALLDELRQRHGAFNAHLQMNLTVLATAHAVSESLMRGVSDEMARKATPSGYGATGRAATPTNAGHQPLALSRTL